jgi:hypothetical protein
MKLGFTALLLILPLANATFADEAAALTPQQVVHAALEAQATLPDELPQLPGLLPDMLHRSPDRTGKPTSTKDEAQSQATLHAQSDAISEHMGKALGWVNNDAASAADSAVADSHAAAGQRQSTAAKAKAAAKAGKDKEHEKPSGSGHGD